MEESRKEQTVIDVKGIQTAKQLHMVLKESLDFPDFYGKNWDAFWDAITGLVAMPKNIIFENWMDLEGNLPEDSALLKELLDDYNKEMPGDNWKVNISYK
ncbi:barstar family protein [Enterococcus larvae]|uniref:barstar family protein n=1 Tax=Enterococcus larvae TaxID=2794352 RepID=UPI003F376E65